MPETPELTTPPANEQPEKPATRKAASAKEDTAATAIAPAGRVGNLCFLQPKDRMITVFRPLQNMRGTETLTVPAREYLVPEGTEHLIHVVPSENQVPHTDPYTRPKPQEGGVIMVNPAYFFQSAAYELSSNDAFRLQNNREVYQVLRNLNAEVIEKRYANELPDPRNGATIHRDAIKALLAKKQVVIYGTKTFTAADILHLPDFGTQADKDVVNQLPE